MATEFKKLDSAFSEPAWHHAEESARSLSLCPPLSLCHLLSIACAVSCSARPLSYFPAVITAVRPSEEKLKARGSVSIGGGLVRGRGVLAPVARRQAQEGQ